MAGFLNTLKSSGSLSRSSTAAQEKVQFRDPDDPRLLYRLSDRARRISLRVNTSEREVIVTVPGRRAMDKARRFARKQSDWINVQLEALPKPQPFVAEKYILMFGETYRLSAPSGRGRPYIDRDARKIIVPGSMDVFAGRTKRLLIREARSALNTSTYIYAEKLGREIGKISVRDTRSRWGSCITRGGKGHISYSWRLICAPPFVLDYVAAHECAHMIEANHSAAYWAVVDSIYDQVKPAKQWLRKNGALLHAVGADY